MIEHAKVSIVQPHLGSTLVPQVPGCHHEILQKDALCMRMGSSIPNQLSSRDNLNIRSIRFNSIRFEAGTKLPAPVVQSGLSGLSGTSVFKSLRSS